MARSVIGEYFAAQDPYDAERLARLRHPEWSAEWPQSGERIPSHESDRQINEQYPGYPKHEVGRVAAREERWALSPSMTPVRVAESGNLWTAEVELEYPGGDRWLSAGVGQLRDSLVHRERSYFCLPLEPAAWRSQWVEPIADDGEARLDLGGDAADEERHRDKIRRFFEAMSSQGWGAIPILWHDDAIEDIPQSGERMRGIDNIVAVPTNHPSPPRDAGHRITGEGDLFVFENDLRYDGSKWFEFVILRFRGEKVSHSVHYFAEPFDAPPWRAPWVERA